MSPCGHTGGWEATFLSKLDALWEYQKADLVTDDFENKAKKSPRRVKLLKLRALIAEMQEQLQKIKESLAAYQENVASFQGEIETQEGRIASYATKLEGMENSESEGAAELMAELRASIDKVRSIEKQLAEMSNSLTGMDRQQKEVRMKAMKARAEYSQLKAAYDEEFKGASEELGRLRAARNALGEKVDAALLQKYKNIKLICSPPMAKPNGDQCGGCHMSLPSVVLTALKEDKGIVECDNCGRILYQP